MGHRTSVISVAALAVVVLAACASRQSEGLYEATRASGVTWIDTPEGVIEVESAFKDATLVRHLDATLADAWEALPHAFRAAGLAGGGVVDEASRIFGVRSQRVTRIDGQRPSRFVDCGHGPHGNNADAYDVFLSAMALVRTVNDVTVLELMIDGFARPRNVAGNPARCQSNGRLEREIAQMVEIRAQIRGMRGR